MILIGSRALKHHFGEEFRRDPSDTDYLVAEKLPVDKVNRIEYHSIPPLFERYNGLDVLPPDAMYTLKVSHIFWPIFQEKHLYDITFLQSKGCRLDRPLFNELFEYWTNVHGPRTEVDFNLSNEDFFNDMVEREVEHDDLHKMINPSPLYLLAKENVHKAEINETMFFSLPLDTRLELVREEGYVLALERFILKGSSVNWRVAYSKMIRALMSRLTPLWLSLFIVENYQAIIKPSINFKNLYHDRKEEAHV